MAHFRFPFSSDSFWTKVRIALAVLAIGTSITAVLLVRTVPCVHMAWDTVSGGPDHSLVNVGHALLQSGLFTPYRLAVTAHDATSGHTLVPAPMPTALLFAR